MTDEQILDEFERRAMKLRDFMGYPTVDGVRVIEGVRALLATPAPLSDEPVANLHGEIMNIRCETPKALSINERLAYQQGHRDARHAAADLANAAPLAQSAEQDRIDAERWRWLKKNDFWLPCSPSGTEAAIDAAIAKGASK
jgi:hypothetical protein